MTQNTLEFLCALPIPEHARIVMEWRNNPDSLRNSYNQMPKVWDTFYNEYRNEYFRTSVLAPIFALKDNTKVAFIRFRDVAGLSDPARRCAEVSINVAPQFRGKGIGHEVLGKLKDWAAALGYDDLLAEIKEENAASHKLFLAAGYKFFDNFQKIIDDVGNAILIRRYVQNLTPIRQSKGVFIIAEAGSNWKQGNVIADIRMAKLLIDAAVDAEANAVKFQTYRAKDLYVENAGQSGYLAGSGIQEDIFSLIDNLAMPDEMIPELADYCKQHNIAFMSTPFSPRDFATVDPYVTVHKLASYEINYPHLIDLMAKSGKPVIMSTGASNEEEIAWAVERFRSQGGKDLTLMQCTAKYPAEPHELNLRVIPWLKRRFGVSVGLSDHSLDPISAPISAVALGATVIEKHFTINRMLPGPDHKFAIEPAELKLMVQSIRQTEQMLGAGIKEVLPEELELYHFAKRGIQAIRNISKGECFQDGTNIAVLRPGNQFKGVHPRYLTDVVGKRAVRDIPLGKGLELGDWA